MVEQNHYIYTIHPARLEMVTAGPTEEEAAIVSRHASYLEELTEKGVALLVGRTTNRDEKTFGIVILQTTTEDRARSIMDNDPAVAAGVMRSALYPFRVVFSNEKALSSLIG